MSSAPHSIAFDQPIPIFPLPNTVLLPRAILPLHLFEPRYVEMMQDTLREQRLISMALLKPGYAEKYYTHSATVHPVLCVGFVTKYERLRDGRYNLLLQGLCRASIRREDLEKTYRRGWLQPLAEGQDLSETESLAIRRQLRQAADDEVLAIASPSGILLEVIDCPHLSVSDMLDLLAFNLIKDPPARQAFLATLGVNERADRLRSILNGLRRTVRSTRQEPGSGMFASCGVVPSRSRLHRSNPSDN